MAELRGIPTVVDPLHRGHERLLASVVRVGLDPGHGQRDRPAGAQVALEQAGRGGVVSPPYPVHQLGVGLVHGLPQDTPG